MSDSTAPTAAHAVFLSYAHEDAAAARRIAEGLRALGIEVWFDQSELRGGDAWDQKIRKQIKECALFLPIVSQHTQARGEGYFRLEWKLAVERTHHMAEGMPFLTPVALDRSHEADALVPPEFLRVHWTRLAEGEPTPEFLAQIKRLLDAPRKSTAMRKAESAGSKFTTASATPQFPAPTAPVAASVAPPGSAPLAVPPVRPTSSAVGQAVRARLAWLLALAAVVVIGVFGWSMRPGKSDLATPSEHSAPPSPPSTLTSSNGPMPEKPGASPAADKSVAVLAFADLSAAHDSEYFSDGISEELLNVLAKVPGLKVTARTSAFFFKGKNLPIPEIASKLGVAYVVEGSVQRVGDRIKITAQFIKAADGFHVWSDTFLRDAKDVFAVEEEIAGLIAKQLSLKLGASSAVTVNPRAFELYLQGRQAWSLRNAPAYVRAEACFNQALAIEPEFGLARAGLADVWLLRNESRISQYANRDSPDVILVQKELERVLSRDPTLPEPHASLGMLLGLRWQQSESDHQLRRAIALNPNFATAHQWRARERMLDGWVDDALAEMKLAMAADPLAPRVMSNAAMVLSCAGHATESMQAAERALALQPDASQAVIWKIESLLALGRVDEALAAARRTTDPSRNAWNVPVFARSGLTQEAETALASLIGGTDLYARVRGHLELGRKAEAVKALKLEDVSKYDLEWMFYLPIFDQIRSEPAFVRLLSDTGMTAAHARAQAWRAAHPPEKK